MQRKAKQGALLLNRPKPNKPTASELMEQVVCFANSSHSNPHGIAPIISPRTKRTLVYIDALDIYVPIQDFAKYALG